MPSASQSDAIPSLTQRTTYVSRPTARKSFSAYASAGNNVHTPNTYIRVDIVKRYHV